MKGGEQLLNFENHASLIIHTLLIAIIRVHKMQQKYFSD
jgi:hypothetical protein